MINLKHFGQRFEDFGENLEHFDKNLWDIGQNLKDTGQNQKYIGQNLKGSGDNIKDIVKNLKDIGNETVLSASGTKKSSTWRPPNTLSLLLSTKNIMLVRQNIKKRANLKIFKKKQETPRFFYGRFTINDSKMRIL